MAPLMMGARGFAGDASLLLLAVAQLRLVVSPRLTTESPVRAAHCNARTGCQGSGCSGGRPVRPGPWRRGRVRTLSPRQPSPIRRASEGCRIPQGAGAVHDTVGLTGLQISILQAIWRRGEATTQDVWEEVSRERPLALTTVATLLSRLERKRIVTHRQVGRQYVYRATVTRAEVRHSKVRDLTDTLFGGDAAALLSHLVRSEEVDVTELDRVREALEEAEKGRHRE